MGGSAIILFVTPPIHYIFLLYPIRRNTFSEKDSREAVFFLAIPKTVV